MSNARFVMRSCAVVALMLGSTALAEKVKNPEYEQWSKFKVGAMSKLEGTSEAAGTTSKQTITTKLVEFTPEKAVVEINTSMEVMGNKMDMPAQKRDVPAMVESNAIPKTAEGIQDKMKEKVPDSKTTEETVQVGDKSIKCTVVESNVDQGGMKIHSKVWTSHEVPAQMVKSETQTSGGADSKTTLTLVEFTTGG